MLIKKAWIVLDNDKFVDILSGRNNFEAALQYGKDLYRYLHLGLSQKIQLVHYSKGSSLEKEMFKTSIPIRTEIQTDLGQIDDELLNLEDQRGLSIDVAQEVLLLARDIYKAYKKAGPELKRQYLLFFWERFEAQNGLILSSYPTPVFEALLQLEAAHYRTSEDAEPQEIAQTNGLILSNLLCTHPILVRTA